MTKKDIDIVCWWIPFKKTRDAFRNCLLEIYSNSNKVDPISKKLDSVSKKVETLSKTVEKSSIFTERHLHISSLNQALIAQKLECDNVTVERIPPPNEYKRSQVIHYGMKYNLKIAIETGTLTGGTPLACRNNFDKFYTIELSKEFFEENKEKFAPYKNIIAKQGDSSHVLPEILKEINEPCLFWLDGHYSGGPTACGVKETPIYEELETIFKLSDYKHVILIDDARCFNSNNTDYKTLAYLEEFVKKHRPNCEYVVYNDIIRIVL